MAGQEMCNCDWGSADEPPEAHALILSIIGSIKQGTQTEDTQPTTRTETTSNDGGSATSNQPTTSTTNKSALASTGFGMLGDDVPVCEAHKTVTNSDTITAGCAIGDDLAGTIVEQSMAIAATFAKGFDFEKVKTDSTKLIAAGLAGQALCSCDWKNSQWGGDYGALNLALGLQSSAPNFAAESEVTATAKASDQPSTDSQPTVSDESAQDHTNLQPVAQPDPMVPSQENLIPEHQSPEQPLLPPSHSDTDPNAW